MLPLALAILFLMGGCSLLPLSSRDTCERLGGEFQSVTWVSPSTGQRTIVEDCVRPAR
jgi:hypothetical protein